MNVKQLSAAESKWLKDFQALMAKCPTKRLGSFTTGDTDLVVYDKTVFDAHRRANPRDMRDDVIVHQELGTELTRIDMPFQVDGVCG